MQHVFVYGTLLFPEFVEALTGSRFTISNGRLNGFRRCAIKGVEYPAVIPCSDALVDGKILLDVDERSFQLLQFFEGEEYEETSIQIESADGLTNATVFVWRGKLELLPNDWDEQHFAENSLTEYVQLVAPATIEEFERSRS
jgi:gamma-glutamylcyclotransferase (GGCT)/AIG2-like uncharacterized protein YtfP